MYCGSGKKQRSSRWTSKLALCALRFIRGSYQGTVATDEYVAVFQQSFSVSVRRVARGIVRRLGRWVDFPRDDAAKATVKRGLLRHNNLKSAVGCIDETLIAIKRPRGDDDSTYALYWCRKQQCALNVMVVCHLNLQLIGATHPALRDCEYSMVFMHKFIRPTFCSSGIFGATVRIGARGNDREARVAACQRILYPCRTIPSTDFWNKYTRQKYLR